MGRQMADRALIQSLNAAAALIQNSIGSQELVLQAFQRQIVTLGLRGGIALLDQDREHLTYISVAYPKGPIQDVLTSVSKLVGLSIDGFKIPYGKVDIYREVIDGKRSVFVKTSGPILEQVLPAAARPFLAPLLKVFSQTPGVYCPLFSSGTVIGLLNMLGADLSGENVTEVTAFANHISVALDNAKLLDKLKNSEDIFRSFIEQSTDGFVLVDEKGLVIEWNNGIEKISGIERNNAVGKPFWEIQFSLLPRERRTPQRLEYFKSILKKGVESGSFDVLPKDIEVTIARPDGTPVSIQQTVFPVKTIRGYLLGSVVRDVTEKKKIEETLRNNEKLESIGILAGGIAHDFNNLLTGIFGYLDLARFYNKTGVREKVSENLSSAFGVFNRAKNLAQQLLTFSKGGKPVKKILGLKPLLMEVTTFALSGSTVTPRFSIQDDLWACEVDEDQFKQVIDNLVINARQAMPDGGSVLVSAENFVKSTPDPLPLPQGRYIKISIQDFGVGISPDDLARIFDPFFTTKPEGSGLGLATAYSIVRKHDGLLSAESQQGKGSTFTLYIPATVQAAENPGTVLTKDHYGRGRALVMDDEPYIRDYCGQALRSMGYSVDDAADGREAIEKYRSGMGTSAPFSFVILDLTIPGGMAGEATLSELLKIDPAVIAIASSGYSEDPIMADPSRFGFAGKLRKPYRQTELGEVLERIFGGK
jgi:two-component system cell cycle sensor histidine kinase/response regulator CckA